MAFFSAAFLFFLQHRNKFCRSTSSSSWYGSEAPSPETYIRRTKKDSGLWKESKQTVTGCVDNCTISRRSKRADLKSSSQSVRLRDIICQGKEALQKRLTTPYFCKLLAPWTRFSSCSAGLTDKCIYQAVSSCK